MNVRLYFRRSDVHRLSRHSILVRKQLRIGCLGGPFLYRFEMGLGVRVAGVWSDGEGRDMMYGQSIIQHIQGEERRCECVGEHMSEGGM